MIHTDTTVEAFLEAYKNGQREFSYLSFPMEGSAAGQDLREVAFYDCFLFTNFQNANLQGAKFVRCNIKYTDFFESNFKNGLIKNCAVCAMSMVGVNVDGLKFEANYFHGNEMTQDDLEWYTKPNESD